ncbi:MAG: membrane protein [Candidatus Cloacimonetes bacterium 4572_65]|nr:MAG: membrane protein [Candidatus Cloacimonetes bacterium 4572_65]
MRSKLKSFDFKQIMGIILGSILYGMGYSWFLVPYQMSPGGVGGIAQVFNHFFSLPVGIISISINIPLFVVSFFMIGKTFGSRSIYGMLISALMIDAVSFPMLQKIGFIQDLTPYTYMFKGREILAMLGPEDVYLSAIAGSVLLGLGLGLIFRFRGSTGGTDIPVALIKQKTGVSVGTGYWIVETLIILSVALIFKDVKIVIWGYINLFISSKITDLTSEGLPYIKSVQIISTEAIEIKNEIYKQLNRGVTIFKGKSGWSGRDLDVLMCVCNRRQVAPLTDLVKSIDPNSFVILNDVYDVMGYGFKSRQLNLQDENKPQKGNKPKIKEHIK